MVICNHIEYVHILITQLEPERTRTELTIEADFCLAKARWCAEMGSLTTLPLSMFHVGPAGGERERKCTLVACLLGLVHFEPRCAELASWQPPHNGAATWSLNCVPHRCAKTIESRRPKSPTPQPLLEDSALFGSTILTLCSVILEACYSLISWQLRTFLFMPMMHERRVGH